jgi:hypothetical protein
MTGAGAEQVRDAIAAAIRELPEQLRRSLTWDQGAEMAEHAKLRIPGGVQVYFCDPQSPWQRGTSENTNGLLRQYFPKATELWPTAPRTSRPSPLRSTAGRARHLDGGPPPRSSTSTSPQQPDPTPTTPNDTPGTTLARVRQHLGSLALWFHPLRFADQ